MIEKFSDEELRQIMKELGIKDKGIRMETAILEEISELEDISSRKPEMRAQSPRGKIYECVLTIVCFSLNNLIETRKGYWRCSNSLRNEDREDFKQMFREILEIIKKHNRKWEGGRQ